MEKQEIKMFIEGRPMIIKVKETEEITNKMAIEKDGYCLKISKYSDQEGRNIDFIRYIGEMVVDITLTKFPEYNKRENNKTLEDYINSGELIEFRERVRWALVKKFVEEGLIEV